MVSADMQHAGSVIENACPKHQRFLTFSSRYCAVSLVSFLWSSLNAYATVAGKSKA